MSRIFIFALICSLVAPVFPSFASQEAEIVLQRRPPLPPQPRPPHPPPPPPPHRPPPHRPPPPPPPHRPPPQQPVHEERTRNYHNQLFRHGDLINLRADLRLDYWNYAGYTVDYVVVRVNNPDPRSQEIVLLINRHTEDWLRPDQWHNTLTVRGWKDLDREIDTLELQIGGWIQIDSISVYMTYNR